LGSRQTRVKLFLKFIKEHQKEYESVAEFQRKLEIFVENLRHIESHAEFSPYMDLTHEEFKNGLTLNLANLAELKATMAPYVGKLMMGEVPESYDWRDHNAVSPVKDQKRCGSCWAFSAVGNIEGVYAIKNGSIKTFSEQQLVDCDDEDGGCNGGFMNNAFHYLSTHGGLMTDNDYPYTGTGGTCKFNPLGVAVELTTFQDVSKNEDEIKNTLFENGPLAIAVNATPFQFYTKGILTPTKQSCNPAGLNHGVTLVGYGSENGQNFWIIKNSWGKTWGEQGYIRLARGIGACGMNTNVSTAVLK